MRPMKTYSALARASGAPPAMSWLARLGRRVRAERAREHARIGTWEYEGGALFHSRNAGYEASRRHA